MLSKMSKKFLKCIDAHLNPSGLDFFFSQVTIYLTGNSTSHEISSTMHTADQDECNVIYLTSFLSPLSVFFFFFGLPVNRLVNLQRISINKMYKLSV